LCGSLIAPDGRCGDDHVATVVESDRKHQFGHSAPTADHVAAAAAFHPVDTDRSAGAECRTLAVDETDVTDPIEIVVVGHPDRTIAEADLGSEE